MSTKKIKTICYGDVKEFETAEDAILYYMEGMSWCDPNSNEFRRYETIVDQLLIGCTVASDGQ